MAGDWLKMETSTPEKAEVLAITARMGWDDSDLTVGKLFRLWRWFDQHTIDGNAVRVTPALLDRIVGVTGFCEAVQEVGWLAITDCGVMLPKFDRHNGATAKSRSLTAKRVQKHKLASNDNANGNGVGNAGSVSAALPREEREKSSKPPSLRDAPLEGKKSKSVAFSAWLAEIKTAGEKPVSSYATLWEYAETVGIDREWVQIAWLAFVERYSEDEKAKRKRYIDWRRVFLRAVKENWFGLWFWSEADKAWRLSSKGVAADMATRESA